MRVVLTGGGSGGHLVPFEPLVDALRVIHREQYKQLPGWVDRSTIKIYFLGVSDAATRDFFHRLGVKVITIPAAKLRRYPSPRTFSDLVLRMPIGFLRAFFYLWLIMPDVVISRGGYGSVPVSLVAAFYRIPYLLHESDAISGLATRLTASWASVITVGFASTRHAMRRHKSKTIVTGTPVRSGLVRETQSEAKQLFGFQSSDPVLLVMGGSQGAEKINNLLLEILPELLSSTGVIHLTGPDHLDQIKQAAATRLAQAPRRDYYKPFGYLTDRMGSALVAADVVVSRAGATTLAELARLHKAAVLIPLPQAAQDHQQLNAQVFEVAEAARVIGAENLSRVILKQNILDLMQNEGHRTTLATNVARLDHPNAARDIAGLAFKLAMGLVPRQPTLAEEPERTKGTARKQLRRQGDRRPERPRRRWLGLRRGRKRT